MSSPIRLRQEMNAWTSSHAASLGVSIPAFVNGILESVRLGLVTPALGLTDLAQEGLAAAEGKFVALLFQGQAGPLLMAFGTLVDIEPMAIVLDVGNQGGSENIAIPRAWLIEWRVSESDSSKRQFANRFAIERASLGAMGFRPSWHWTE